MTNYHCSWVGLLGIAYCHGPIQGKNEESEDADTQGPQSTMIFLFFLS